MLRSLDVRRFLLFLMLLLPVVASGVSQVETLECSVAEATQEGGCEDECAGCECCPLTPRLAFELDAAESLAVVVVSRATPVESSPLRAAVPAEILHVPLA